MPDLRTPLRVEEKVGEELDGSKILQQSLQQALTKERVRCFNIIYIQRSEYHHAHPRNHPAPAHFP